MNWVLTNFLSVLYYAWLCLFKCGCIVYVTVSVELHLSMKWYVTVCGSGCVVTMYLCISVNSVLQKEVSSCVCDYMCNCSCPTTLVYLYTKVLYILCIFVHYYISPVILGITLYDNPLSLVTSGR